MIRTSTSMSARPVLAILVTIAGAVGLAGCDNTDSTLPGANADKASALAATTPRSGKVVANVDGSVILESDLELAEAEIGSNLGTLPKTTKRRVLIEYLVENQLFANAARKEDLAKGPDFNRHLAYWRQRALREAYFEKKVKSQIGVGAARALYEDKVKMLKPEEEIEARHILVAKEEMAKELVEKARGGADFAELAKEHSGDAGSKEKGGMLGYFGKGQMVPQFEQAAFALKKGEVSDPVKSQYGWHIIKLENRRQKPAPKFDEVKDEILGSLIHKRAQKVAKELRAAAKIEYLDPEVKAMIEADKKRAANQREALEKQMKEQIEKMTLGDKDKAGDATAPKGSDNAPTPNN